MISVISSQNKQQGVILMVLVLMLFSVGATLFLSTVNTHTYEVRKQLDMRQEMEKAKQGLISYAMNYPSFGYDKDADTRIDDEGPGRLICPDTNNDGITDVTDNCADNVRGRLPERFIFNSGATTSTITINDAFAINDQQFWYAVSPAFKEITQSGPLDTDGVNHLSTGTFSIDGVGAYVAVIIAPGEELAHQDRLASEIDPANYLEQGNLNGTAFVNSHPADPDAFNDQVIGMKLSEINILIELAIADYTREAIDIYYSEFTSLPGDLATLETYMENNNYNWFVQEQYLSDTNYLSPPEFVFPGAVIGFVQIDLDSCPGYQDVGFYFYNPDIEGPPATLTWQENGTPCYSEN